jgi:glycosyltransferase involved in cell wall biosynthesis
VISDAGGAREIGTAEHTCLTHPPGDASVLEKQIERLVVAPEVRRRLGSAAAESVRERFTPARCAASLREAYSAAVERHVHA